MCRELQSLWFLPDWYVGDGDVVDIQCAGHGAVEIHFPSMEIYARANFSGFRGGQRVLIGHDIEQVEAPT